MPSTCAAAPATASVDPAVLGPDETRRLLGRAARLIGMQFYDETAALPGVTERDAAAFARYLRALARAQGEEVEVDAVGPDGRVRQTGWGLMAGVDVLVGADQGRYFGGVMPYALSLR